MPVSRGKASTAVTACRAATSVGHVEHILSQDQSDVTEFLRRRRQAVRHDIRQQYPIGRAVRHAELSAMA